MSVCADLLALFDVIFCTRFGKLRITEINLAIIFSSAVSTIHRCDAEFTSTDEAISGGALRARNQRRRGDKMDTNLIKTGEERRCSIDQEF